MQLVVYVSDNSPRNKSPLTPSRGFVFVKRTGTALEERSGAEWIPPALAQRALEGGVISGMLTTVGSAWVSQVAERRREGTQTGPQEGSHVP